MVGVFNDIRGLSDKVPGTRNVATPPHIGVHTCIYTIYTCIPIHYHIPIYKGIRVVIENKGSNIRRLGNTLKGAGYG